MLDSISRLDKKLSEKIFQRMSEPDMQIAILEAQKTHAKYGEKDKMKQLADLLVAKGLEDLNSSNNLFLDEAIGTISRMNQLQIDFLSYLVMKHTVVLNICSVNDLYENYIKNLLDYSHSLFSISNIDISHMDKIGCIKIRPYEIINYTLSDIIKKRYSPILHIGNLEQSLAEIDKNLIKLIEQDKIIQRIELTDLGIFIGRKNVAISKQHQDT